LIGLAGRLRVACVLLGLVNYRGQQGIRSGGERGCLGKTGRRCCRLGLLQGPALYVRGSRWSGCIGLLKGRRRRSGGWRRGNRGLLRRGCRGLIVVTACGEHRAYEHGAAQPVESK